MIVQGSKHRECCGRLGTGWRELRNRDDGVANASPRSRHSYKAPTLQLQAAAAERGVPYAAFRTDCTSSAVVEVMFQMVAAVLQAMEGLVPDFPVCASGGGDARDVVASDLEVGE